MNKLLLMYQSSDQAIGGRIFDRLAGRFSNQAVLNFASLGTDDTITMKTVREFVRQSKCVIFLLGPTWLADLNRDHTTVITDGSLQLVLEEAVRNNVELLPILLDGTRMPSSEELPHNMASLAGKNALEVESGRRFDDDMRRVLTVLETWVNPVTQAAQLRPQPSEAAVAKTPRRNRQREDHKGMTRKNTGYFSLLVTEALFLAVVSTVGIWRYLPSVWTGCFTGLGIFIFYTTLLALPEWRLVACILLTIPWALVGILIGNAIDANMLQAHTQSALSSWLPYLVCGLISFLFLAVNISIYRRSSVWVKSQGNNLSK